MLAIDDNIFCFRKCAGRTIKVLESGAFSSFDHCLMKVLGVLMLSFTKKEMVCKRWARDELRNKDSIVSILFS
jgi:hypothetical protein